MKLRVRRCVSPFLLTALVAAFLLGGYAVWDYVAASAVTKVIDAARADHLQLRTEAGADVALPAGAPDAGPFYTAAAILGSVDTPFGSTATTNDRLVAAQRATQLQEAWYQTGAVPAELMERVRVDLAERSDALDLLDRATTRKFVGFARGTDYAARIPQLEHLANLASARTLSETLAGRVDSGVSAAVAELGLFGWRGRPVPGEYRPRLIATAINILALLRTRQLGAEHLERVERALRDADRDDGLAQAFSGMRQSHVDWFLHRVQYRTRSFGLTTFVSGIPGESDWIPRPLAARRIGQRLQVYQRLIDASRLPWTERLDSVAAEARSGAWDDDGGFLAKQGWTTDPIGIAGVPASLAAVRAARAAVAVERYRLARGALPEVLEALVPDFLDAVPIDPYSGGGLVYRPMESGYRLYSVASNRQDDGGDLALDRPVFSIATSR